ncbi:hypothetical protein [Caenispirillum bisanense]|uniref:Uncharacterized protein n=1 Tax=Caenispirillum bisanense TaxID=414052 RepID=A0A286GYT8_9PROT|nr:hypothetical protein [Caenispirillum bisanense]SOE00690.1 hypothetical protein SAMN05421508_113101 [Caenispirillum bisanense]
MALSTAHHLLLSWQSFCDGADVDWSASTGFLAGAPASRLADHRLWRAARTSGLTAEIVWYRARPMAISMIALLGHSLSERGTWSVECASQADFSDAETVLPEELIWPQTVPFGSRPWGEWPWNGRELTPGGNKGLALFEARYRSWWRVRIDDTRRTDGVTWLDLGRLIADSPFRPRRNIALGWEIGVNSDTQRRRSRGGTLWAEAGPSWSELVMDLADLTRDEAMTYGLDVDRLVGTHTNVLAIVDPADVGNRHRLAVYGPLDKLSRISNPQQLRYRKTISIIEDL